MQTDLNRARELLSLGSYTCVLCRDGLVYTDTRRGIRPLLELLARGTDLHGFAVADKVVGKAAALLYCLMGVRQVYAPVISSPAVSVLQAHGILLQYDTVVPAIRNRTQTGLCPMETAVWDLTDPKEALPAVREALAALQNK